MNFFKSIICGLVLASTQVMAGDLPAPHVHNVAPKQLLPKSSPEVIPDPYCMILMDNGNHEPVEIHAALITLNEPFQESESDYGLRFELDDGVTSITFTVYMNSFEEVRDAYHEVNDRRIQCRVSPQGLLT